VAVAPTRVVAHMRTVRSTLHCLVLVLTVTARGSFSASQTQSRQSVTSLVCPTVGLCHSHSEDLVLDCWTSASGQLDHCWSLEAHSLSLRLVTNV
jgi:hypothetical protein